MINCSEENNSFNLLFFKVSGCKQCSYFSYIEINKLGRLTFNIFFLFRLNVAKINCLQPQKLDKCKPKYRILEGKKTLNTKTNTTFDFSKNVSGACCYAKSTFSVIFCLYGPGPSFNASLWDLVDRFVC